jgi:hypothetical protein
MNSWGGGFHRPTGEGSARAPTPARPWPAHDCQTALHHVGFLQASGVLVGLASVSGSLRGVLPPIISIGWRFATWCAGRPTRRETV